MAAVEAGDEGEAVEDAGALEMAARGYLRIVGGDAEGEAGGEQPVEERDERRGLDLGGGGAGGDDSRRRSPASSSGRTRRTVSSKSSMVPAIIGLGGAKRLSARSKCSASARAAALPASPLVTAGMKPANQTDQVAWKSKSVPSLSKTMPRIGSRILLPPR